MVLPGVAEIMAAILGVSDGARHPDLAVESPLRIARPSGVSAVFAQVLARTIGGRPG
jgi:hypothetical protein